MNLILYSWGPWKNKQLEKILLENLRKPPEKNKLFILTMDTTSDFHVKHLGIAKQWFKTNGFTEKNINIINLQTETVPSFEDLDILYMWGGNTFHYVKRIQETGLDNRIMRFIERDGLYLGSSAGAMIMSPDIDENLTTDVNDINLADTSGLNIVDFYLLVHWDTSFNEHHTEVVKYGWKSGKKVIVLTDNQAIHVHDNTFKIIST